MPEGADLTLGVLFAGRVDNTFRRETQKLRDILLGLSKRMAGTRAESDRTRRSARGMADEFSNVGKKISRVQGGFQRLTAALKVTASYGLAGTFLFGIIRGLKQGTAEIANFDQALKNLQAITSATNPEIAALRDVILDVAENTRYSANEISEAAVTLGQAGFTASESLDVLRSVADLSTGTLSSMSDASDLLTSALRAFGENAQQSSRFADVFASAINRSKLDVQKLRIAFNYLGPIANQVGLDLENTAAATMVLANAGLRGSTIGTGFRRVLQLLVNPTKKLKVLFASAGADLDKLNPAVASMSDIVEELSKLLGQTVDPAERARRAFELFGLRGATVAAALGQAGREGFESMLKEVYRVGIASQLAEKQMEGLAVMAKNLKDRMVNLAIAIGEGGIADAFRLILPFLRTTVSLFTTLASTAVGRFTIALTTLTAVLGIVRLAIRYLVIQLTALSAGMSVATIQRYAAAHGILATAITGTTRAVRNLWTLLKTNPWFLLAAAISTAAVAIYTYVRRQREIIPNLRKEGVELDKNTQKLKDYQETLSQSREGSLKYRSVLERLINDYPELADQIDLVNGKFLDQGKALEELITKYQKLRLQNLANTFSEYVDQIKSAERNIRGLEYALERNRGEKAFVRRYTERLRELKVELRTLKGEQTATFETIAAALLKSGLTTAASFEEIRDTISETFGVGRKEVESLAYYVRYYYDRIKLLNSNARKDISDTITSQENILSSYGEKWLTLYRKLDDLRKADLIETIYEMQAKIEKMDETAQRQGWTEEQLQARIRNLNDETYRNFVEKETAKEKRARKTAAEIERAYLSASDQIRESEIAEARASAADRSQRIKESVEDAGKRARLLRQIEETLAADISKINEDFYRKRRDLIDEVSEYQLKASKETLEAEIATAKKSAEILKRRILDEVRDAELRRTLLLNIEEGLQADIERIRQKYADKAAGSRKEKILSLEEEYRVGLISAEQYYKELDRLADEHLISERQRAEQRAKIQDNLWSAFREGLRRSISQLPTWSETIYKIGHDLSEKLASDFTSSFLDFIDGSKSASEAFGDFAKSVIRWLTEMIIKQQIFNAIRESGILGGLFGGGGSATSSGTVGGVDIGIGHAHRGGVVGKDKFPIKNVDISSLLNWPRLHNGLRKDEVPVILQKGEEVIPKGESKESVQIIVNEAPPGTTVQEDRSVPNLRKFIIDVSRSDVLSGGRLDQAVRNTYGLGRAVTAR